MYKFFAVLTKAEKLEDKILIGGVASGTRLDSENEIISVEALESFIKALPLPLTNSHITLKIPGELMGEIGTVVRAEFIKSEDDPEVLDLYIEAELDDDNPIANFLLKKLSKGKKYGFSIEGLAPEFEVRVNEDGSTTRIIKSIIPTAISVTTLPAYQDSYVEALFKSLKEEKVEVEKEKKEDVVTESEIVKEQNHEINAFDKVNKEEQEQLVAKSLNKALSKIQKQKIVIKALKKEIKILKESLDLLKNELEEIKKLPLSRKAVISKSLEEKKEKGLKDIAEWLAKL